MTATFKGYRIRALGNRLYWREPTETFHEFLLELLKVALGANWLKEQAEESPDGRHVVLDWLYAWAEMTTSPAGSGPGPHSAAATGKTQELISLAYDLFKLQQVNELPSKLVSRLRNRTEFQGARYEVAIAASFVRKGFRIDWNRDKSRRGPEFVATHPTTGEVLGVEAKSRRRRGTLNEQGQLGHLASLKADVSGLVENALDQAPGDKPFAIFVDVNLPPESQVPGLYEKMLSGLNMVLEELFPVQPPDGFTILALTNFAWHYKGVEETSDRPAYVVARPSLPPFPFKDEPSFLAVLDSLDSYGRVPMDERDPRDTGP